MRARSPSLPELLASAARASVRSFRAGHVRQGAAQALAIAVMLAILAAIFALPLYGTRAALCWCDDHWAGRVDRWMPAWLCEDSRR